MDFKQIGDYLNFLLEEEKEGKKVLNNPNL